MEWYFALIIMIGLLLILLTTGMRVAWCFFLVCIIGAYIWWGGEKGLSHLVISIRTSLSSFNLLAIPLFVMMGEIMFQSGLGFRMVRTLDRLLGNIPGRLAILSVGGGTLFAVMSGSSAASIALLGSILTPEMEKQGYNKYMSTGPIVGSGCLATLIPPSGLAVLLASIAGVSIGKTLIAIVIPGLLLAAAFVIFIVVICTIRPSIAPSYQVESMPFKEKLVAGCKDILPLGIVVLAVLGSIFMGIATPTEAAALGTLACVVLAVANKVLTGKVIRKSLSEAVIISAMYFMIIAAGTAYGQLLSMSQASAGIFQIVMKLADKPILLFAGIHIVLMIIGMFMSTIPALMIAIPLFMPIVTALGYDPVWFVVTTLMNVEVSAISPPYGMGLFVMKSVAPSHITIKDIYKGGLPFLFLTILVLAILIVFPSIPLWLPDLMK